MGLWLLWNLSFGSPFYFAFGPNSVPEAQQHVLTAGLGQTAKGDFWLAEWVFAHDVADNLGLQVSVLALIGLGYLLVAPKLPLSRNARCLLLGLLAAPVIFNILSLYLGFSTMNLPELNLPVGPRNQWFNVRYGVVVLPMAAIAIGLLANYRRVVAGALVAVVLLQAGMMYQHGLITVFDGTRGASAFTDGDVAAVLHNNVQPGDAVLMSFISFSPLSFASGLDLRQYIHEGVRREWRPALDQPERYAKWVVMANGDVGDPVYTALGKVRPQAFLAHYSEVYHGVHASVYQRKAAAVSLAK